MSDHNTTIAAGAPHPPHVQAFVDLANCLLGVIGAESPDAATELDALIHTYVAIVRTHPQLGHLAHRSLVSASRALIATDGQPPALPPSTAFH